ncbi:DegT/DnrJ/EryC1/StrS family aminotransferase [Phycisphaerales bacterium AB-hyl4]|uniref:DegT/DnrJ/EryC1/StrS family aminotransferase n=1 Tax=Natronomicrosphaera hydrolytica TaxID=3242702 RepID=A0ABV4U5A1_9BACT
MTVFENLTKECAMSSNFETLAMLGGSPVSPAPLVPPNWPPVDETTADRLRDLYLSRQWSFHSPAERAFADAYAAHHDASHGIFMANGTVTLESALAAMKVGPGDEVIVPALTWMATAMAVHYVGATPVFVDVEPTTLCLDPAAAEAAVTPRTSAIIAVHLYGGMTDLEAIARVAKRHGLALIEDCAHMQGGKWAGRGVGSWGDVGSFSFQQSKTLSSGEGGICLTNDDRLAERIFRIKHIGYAADEQQGVPGVGPGVGLVCHNYRATAFQAVILHEQLHGIDNRLKRYNATRDIIEAELSNVPGFRVQSRGRQATLQGYYNLLMLADQEPLLDVPRPILLEALAAEGLRVGGTYGPVYRHALYNLPINAYRVAEGRCPVSEETAVDRVFGLSHPWLDVDAETARTIGRIFAKVALNAELLASHAVQKA